jgi:uncharacterized protein YbjT (DUF2867 family)
MAATVEEVLMVEAVVAPAAAGRVALVAGATGLVGREVLAALLADRRYAAVHAVGRKAPGVLDPKLTSHLVDFAHLPALPKVDDVYIALGTTIKVAGSQQAFRAVDFDAVVALAKAARKAGARRLGVVSAMGADAKSRVFYNQVKGEMEAALTVEKFHTLVIARPSMLDGNRSSLKQPVRLGERVGLALMTVLRPVIPDNYRAIQAQDVARALVAAVRDGPKGRHVILSGEMQPH